MASTISRRTFLKVGIIGTITLATAGGLYRITRPESAPSRFMLDGDAHSALRAICAALLQDAIQVTPTVLDRHVALVKAAIAGLPLHTQKEIQDLFGLLTLGPTRRFLVGLPEDWPVARIEDVAVFLQSWRLHRFALMQSAYHALHDLILGPWYADEANWAAIGYPGPLKELR